MLLGQAPRGADFTAAAGSIGGGTDAGLTVFVRVGSTDDNFGTLLIGLGLRHLWMSRR